MPVDEEETFMKMEYTLNANGQSLTSAYEHTSPPGGTNRLGYSEEFRVCLVSASANSHTRKSIFLLLDHLLTVLRIVTEIAGPDGDSRTEMPHIEIP